MAKGKVTTKKDAAPELSLKERTFADQYLINGGNGRQAAIFAKYSERSAEVLANRLLNKPHIKAYIEARATKLFDKYEITQERVLEAYARVAFSDIKVLYNSDGSLKPIHELNADGLAAVAGVEVETITSGRKTTTISKIKQWSKRDVLAALDSICKMKGWNAPEEVKHTMEITVGYGKEE